MVERVIVKEHTHDFAILEDPSGKMDSSVYLLLVLLSVHSFIEGIALGVQNDAQGTWAVMWAIVAHHFFAAFALGVSLLKGGASSKWFFQMVTFFSLTPPVGGILGMAVNLSFESGLAGFLSEAFKAIAAGTFIYVALMEVITEEFKSTCHKDHPDSDHLDQKEKWEKFGFIVFGLVIMTGISMFGLDPHDG